MDTIEPLDECPAGAITNIWVDETIDEDPDYECETDEEDEDAYDGDVAENCLPDEEFVVERVNSNHIRFVY
jgi:hypothetical protein